MSWCSSCLSSPSGLVTSLACAVVLGCTHFPLLLPRLAKLAPWPVQFLDPAPAIARRVVDLIGPATGAAPPAPARLLFTSQTAPSPALLRAFRDYSFGA